ncbi:MAG: TIGR02221 family CRISPR-associated protein [Bacteroides sp.]|nr:TIGR02221 family CRISPR-associated protein [Bacteroides sp.]
MARKVLISFLGTGGNPNSRLEITSREYKTAEYHIDDKTYTRSFVADALTDHYEIDTVFMIGTVKSMWEELYRSFCAKHGMPVDEDYYLELGETSAWASHESTLYLPEIEKIENALGKDSRIILINYGINEEELNNNIAAILSIEKDLKNGDELYVDITHSFRSLPLLIMNILMYLQNVSKKNITIKGISYGMLDVNTEFGYVPVVDLKKVMEVNEWISGAYSFSEFGNAYKISKLLETIDKDTANRLNDFTNAKNINNMAALQKSAGQLSGIKLDNLSPIAKMTISPVVKEFIQSIGSFSSTSEFQYKLAKWHRDKHNYYAAYLTLVEAIITYVCEECSLAENDKDERENAKERLLKNPDYKDLKKIYGPLNDVRRRLAHSLEIKDNNANIKKRLNDALIKVEDIILPSKSKK